MRVQPRAGANEIAGVRDGVLLVRVTAPPAGGKANDAVRKLIARRLRVGVTRVEIVRGAGVARQGPASDGLRRELRRRSGL